MESFSPSNLHIEDFKNTVACLKTLSKPQNECAIRQNTTAGTWDKKNDRKVLIPHLGRWDLVITLWLTCLNKNSQCGKLWERKQLLIPYQVTRTASATTPRIPKTWDVYMWYLQNNFWIPATEKLKVEKNQWDARGSVGGDCLHLDLSVFLSLSPNLQPYPPPTFSKFLCLYLTFGVKWNPYSQLILWFRDPVILFISTHGLICTLIQAGASLTDQFITTSLQVY